MIMADVQDPAKVNRQDSNGRPFPMRGADTSRIIDSKGELCEEVA